MANRFVWYELVTPDPSGAVAFYARVIGWTAQDSGLTDRAYTILHADGVPIGGVMAIPAERPAAAPPLWIGYIAVDDVDSLSRHVTEAGGHIHRQPQDIPGVGRFAVAADPHGAVFILFRPFSDAAAPPSAPTVPGHVGWHELQAGDLDAAFAFYARLFGWTKAEAIDMGPMGTYQIFAAGGVDIGGMMTKADAGAHPRWQYYINVEALDDAMARIDQAGGRVLFGPQQVPGGSWILNGLDPQGAAFALVAPKR